MFPNFVECSLGDVDCSLNYIECSLSDVELSPSHAEYSFDDVKWSYLIHKMNSRFILTEAPTHANGAHRNP